MHCLMSLDSRRIELVAVRKIRIVDTALRPSFHNAGCTETCGPTNKADPVNGPSGCHTVAS